MGSNYYIKSLLVIPDILLEKSSLVLIAISFLDENGFHSANWLIKSIPSQAFPFPGTASLLKKAELTHFLKVHVQASPLITRTFP